MHFIQTLLIKIIITVAVLYLACFMLFDIGIDLITDDTGTDTGDIAKFLTSRFIKLVLPLIIIFFVFQSLIRPLRTAQRNLRNSRQIMVNSAITARRNLRRLFGLKSQRELSPETTSFLESEQIPNLRPRPVRRIDIAQRNLRRLFK
jgi:hypothetical protein